MEHFAAVLQCYAVEFDTYCQVISQSGMATVDHSYRGAINTGHLVGDCFGALFGTLAAVIGGYLSGNAVAQQVEAQAESFQQAFKIMLRGYDQTMNALMESAFSMIESYDSALREAGV